VERDRDGGCPDRPPSRPRRRPSHRAGPSARGWGDPRRPGANTPLPSTRAFGPPAIHMHWPCDRHSRGRGSHNRALDSECRPSSGRDHAARRKIRAGRQRCSRLPPQRRAELRCPSKSPSSGASRLSADPCEGPRDTFTRFSGWVCAWRRVFKATGDGPRNTVLERSA
jgi:hypothetical protein